jgi:hypothetical protein
MEFGSHMSTLNVCIEFWFHFFDILKYVLHNGCIYTYDLTALSL